MLLRRASRGRFSLRVYSVTSGDRYALSAATAVRINVAAASPNIVRSCSYDTNTGVMVGNNDAGGWGMTRSVHEGARLLNEHAFPSSPCSYKRSFSSAALLSQKLPPARQRSIGQGKMSRFGGSQQRGWFGGRGSSKDGDGTAGGKQGQEGGGSREELARSEEEVLEALSVVHEVCTEKAVVQLGLVQDLFINLEGGLVMFALRLPTMALPGRQDLASTCEAAVRKLPWVKNVIVTFKTRKPRRRQRHIQQQQALHSLNVARGGGGGAGASSPFQGARGASAPGMESVRDVICVSSCKGGVGKSTVAVNLAYSLAAKGASVGILDADIYGPSLPTLVNPDDVALRVSPAYPDLKLLTPVSHRGVACMSFGWVNAKAGVPGAGGRGAAVMRGPMVAKVINQLLLGTDWGELEYLIIDMPPGTGDIQITLCQALQMSGAVIVTTPQKLSYVDVVKGIDMFADLKVPVVSVVENMSYFECNHGERHKPFGPGHADKLVDECGIAKDNLFSLPLSPAIAAGSDSGDPVAVSDPDGQEAQVYLSLADAVVRESYRAGEGGSASVPEVSFNPDRGIIVRYISEVEAAEFVIPPFQLRTRDPATGLPLSSEETAAVPENVTPTTLQTKGNYAVSISWSDGHRGAIYSYVVLRKIAEVVAAEGGAV